MKMPNLSEWAVTHRRMVLFLILATLLVGIFSFTRLNRLEDPVFQVPVMTATVVWPGATAEEVQELVVSVLERELQQLEHVDFIRSFARPGYGGITLNLIGGTSAAQQERAWYQARKRIGDVRDSLPEGIRGPFFNDEFTDVYGILYAIRSDSGDMVEMHALAEQVRKALQRIPQINKVDIFGKRPEKVYVMFDAGALARRQLSPLQLVDALQRHTALVPAGAYEQASERVAVRIGTAVNSVAELASIRLNVGGSLLRLGDVARIEVGLDEPASARVRRNGSDVLAIGVTVSRQADMLAVGRDLEQVINQLRQQMPVGVTIEQYADQPRIIEASIWEFEKAFLEALAIVLAVCFVFLGWRTGVVVAASVPLVLGLVAIVMYMVGWTLDRISLGALIIALGLLVDDAIIAVEMMVVKMEEGWDRVKAATFAYTSTAFPMLTGTLVTVAGFMPVGFARSTAGEYAGGIFWIVGLALLASWVVAVLFTPYLGVKLLPRTLAPAGHDPHDKPIYHRLRRWVAWAVARRGWVIAASAALLIAAALGMTMVQQQFFPVASRLELLVDLRLREGASIEATQREVERLETWLAKDPGVSAFTAYVGVGSPRFYLSLGPELPNPGYAQLVIMTPDVESREAVRQRLMAMFDEGRLFPDVRGRVTRLEFGPPVGYPVQFRVIGPDTHEVRRIAEQVRVTVSQSPLVRNTHLEWNEKVRRIVIDPDDDKLARLGMTRADLATAVRTVIAGTSAGTLRVNDERVELVVRALERDRLDPERLAQLPILVRDGIPVPLSAVARVRHGMEEPVIWRRDREMALSVRSDLADGVQGPDATNRIWPALQPLIAELPPGYRIERGGAWEESAKANRALAAVFPAMFAVTLLLLMIQLQSFRRVGLVFLTFPLGLIGAVPALLIFQAPFGFVALLGLIALGGMIMRNTIILVDQIDQDIAAGMNRAQAIVEATVRRSRPVVLTAASAVLAMIPLSRSVFWGPMAIVIMGGLLVATALTLLAVPALYAAFLGRDDSQSKAAPQSGNDARTPEHAV